MTPVTVVKNADLQPSAAVCDDIELHADGDRTVKTTRAAWATRGLRTQTAERLYPDALVDGSRPRDAAVEAAASFLYDADMPLVYGLSNITCEARAGGRRPGRAVAASRQPHLALTRSDQDSRPLGGK